MKKCAVIMAGGTGERFWPKSRQSMPKQFLALGNDNETMIQKTVSRISRLVDCGDIYIVTNEKYKEIISSQIPNIPEDNILCEPCARNTAPCIAYAAAVISHKYNDAVMIVLPSDHLIRYDEMFLDTIKQSCITAQEKQALVTVGIVPTYPETGYGYIKFRPNAPDSSSLVYSVDQFVEKPSSEIAKEYLVSGKYLWNSGMFIWTVTSIAEKFRTIMPRLYDFYLEIKEGCGKENYGEIVEKCYSEAENISIDFGILEHSDNIFTIPGSFGWDDVGSWLALERINITNEHGNIEKGNVIAVDTVKSIIVGGDKLIAAVGLEDLVIVDADDAILVCGKDSTAKIKTVLDRLRKENRGELL